MLDVIRAVQREQFVDPSITDMAYLPTAFAIGREQTISHPLVVASMTLAARLRPHDRVLEVGTGSGYQASITSCLAASIVTMEIEAELAGSARDRLLRLGYRNVDVQHGDGCLDRPDDDPYDAILVTAGSALVPPALLPLLRPGGRLIIPLGSRQGEEQLVVLTRMRSSEFRRRSIGPARFVPLRGCGSRHGDQSRVMDRLPHCFGTPITFDVRGP